jgi:hypothetical protein
MDLINLYENRNATKIVLDGKDHFVKLQGTTDEPYFAVKTFARYWDTQMQNRRYNST